MSDAKLEMLATKFAKDKYKPKFKAKLGEAADTKNLERLQAVVDDIWPVLSKHKLTPAESYFLFSYLRDYIRSEYE